MTWQSCRHNLFDKLLDTYVVVSTKAWSRTIISQVQGTKEQFIHSTCFGDKSFQAIDCTGTDNATHNNKIINKIQTTNPITNKQVLVKTHTYKNLSLALEVIRTCSQGSIPRDHWLSDPHIFYKIQQLIWYIVMMTEVLKDSELATNQLSAA